MRHCITISLVIAILWFYFLYQTELLGVDTAFVTYSNTTATSMDIRWMPPNGTLKPDRYVISSYPGNVVMPMVFKDQELVTRVKNLSCNELVNITITTFYGNLTGKSTSAIFLAGEFWHTLFNILMCELLIERHKIT